MSLDDFPSATCLPGLKLLGGVTLMLINLSWESRYEMAVELGGQVVGRAIGLTFPGVASANLI